MLCAGDQPRLLRGIISANWLWIGKSCASRELVARGVVNFIQETGASAGLSVVICEQME